MIRMYVPMCWSLGFWSVLVRYGGKERKGRREIGRRFRPLEQNKTTDERLERSAFALGGRRAAIAPAGLII